MSRELRTVLEITTIALFNSKWGEKEERFGARFNGRLTLDNLCDSKRFENCASSPPRLPKSLPDPISMYG